MHSHVLPPVCLFKDVYKFDFPFRMRKLSSRITRRPSWSLPLALVPFKCFAFSNGNALCKVKMALPFQRWKFQAYNMIKEWTLRTGANHPQKTLNTPSILDNVWFEVVLVKTCIAGGGNQISKFYLFFHEHIKTRYNGSFVNVWKSTAITVDFT